jgi:hypothetical protein
MNFTLRTKRNILSTAMIAVLLFAGSCSARLIDQSRAASVNQPSGTTTVGMIEIPALGLTTKVLEGSNASTLRLAVGHIPGTSLPGPSGNVGLAGHRTTFFRSLRKIKVRGRDSLFHRGRRVQISCRFSPHCSSQCHRGFKCYAAADANVGYLLPV